MAVQAQSMQTENMCTISEEVPKRLKVLKFGQSDTAEAVILKINNDIIEIDEDLKDITTEDVLAELPERSPRYIIYSYIYKSNDGRTVRPLVFVHYNPPGCKTEQSLRYAGCRDEIYKLSGARVGLQLEDSEEFTDEWICDKARFK